MNNLKRVIDILMSVILIPLMAYQVTGEEMHEWIGIVMVSFVIIHQVLNRKWYASLFKGNYMPFRMLSIIINILLLISFALTAISGISMSNHAVPFLYNLVNVNIARVMHLAFSYWAFILMGLHIGMHVNVMTTKMQNNVKSVLAIIFTLISGYGFYLFLKSGILNYITFKTHFAFLDYEKAAPLVYLENIIMIILFAFVGHNVSNIIRDIDKKNNNVLKRIVYIMTSLIIGFILNISIIQNATDNNSWQSDSFKNLEITQNEQVIDNNQVEIFEESNMIKYSLENNIFSSENANKVDETNEVINIVEVNDGFIKLDGGKFLMGSPESEN